MISAEFKRSLTRKAMKIGQRRAQNIQTELGGILQEAVPDGVIEITESGVRISVRRLFARMIGNEKLRNPESFLGDQIL